MRTSGRAILFIIFTVSGFTGLIYESIWTHYLKLFLGHAAYAQTLVLAIFMGGLTLGSWICSRFSRRWGNLLKGYALAEGAIGICAILFHPVFTWVVQFSHASVIPWLGSPLAVYGFKWTVSALLILPQTLLLGMTFPLMSAALLRLFPATPGRSVALLYFTNSLGAAAGVLVSGFVLIRLVGLPGTIMLAGALNVLLALGVWCLARGGGVAPGKAMPTAALADKDKARGLFGLLLFVSLATGATSFMYEIGWIRMLSLVLGSSTHAFELMLSAFIFGLACGGLWVQRRIDRIATPVRFIAAVQVLMGILAIATLPVYGRSFEIMKELLAQLPKTVDGYTSFNLACNAIAMAVMMPATFCAGMTLPLITFALLRAGHGERSIGAVYAANTIGAILGVILAVYCGMPFFGLKGLILIAGGLDMALGIFLLRGIAPKLAFYRTGIVTAACVLVVGAAAWWVRLDPYQMLAGVYRSGRLLDAAESTILFHRDGRTATVSVDVSKSGVMSIRTNGKSDAGVSVLPGQSDSGEESTMVLAAALPMFYQPQARTVANIGLGSGLTTHTVLGNPALQIVDTIEIEPEMVHAARLFSNRVARVYNDPRSHIYIDDAKTFFSAHHATYDIIISEPSNPWVSGVAGLFSDEFYHGVRRYVNADGLFVQWVQLYEINDDLIASVVKALARNFSDYAVFASDAFDIVIVAKPTGTLPNPDPALFGIPELSGALRRVNINTLQDLTARKIGDRQMLDAFFALSPAPANSDYFPVLDQNAAQARFLGSAASNLVQLAAERQPLADMLGHVAEGGAQVSTTAVTISDANPRTWFIAQAMTVRDYLVTGFFVPHGKAITARSRVAAMETVKMFSSGAAPNDPNRRSYLFQTGAYTMSYLCPADCAAIWKMLESGPDAQTLTPPERRYVALFKAQGNRDAAGMSAIARSILDNEADITLGRFRYVLATGMLGDLAQGRESAAAELWERQAATAFGKKQPDLLFRFLVAKTATKRQ